MQNRPLKSDMLISLYWDRSGFIPIIGGERSRFSHAVVSGCFL
jgi:hypothetical protein